MPLPMYPVSIQSINRNLDIGVQDRTKTRSGNEVSTVTSRAVPIFCNFFNKYLEAYYG